jgi:hypothetical protein
MELLKLGVIPIVNENDTVATQEIKLGDDSIDRKKLIETLGKNAPEEANPFE